jgi:hypothetical protein
MSDGKEAQVEQENVGAQVSVYQKESSCRHHTMYAQAFNQHFR